jgi:hypothetical protein
MEILQRKAHRPLRHDLLRIWTRRPKLGNLLFSQQSTLLLHEDYVSLRLSAGAPRCCSDSLVSHDDYCVLLQDIYFIETGWIAVNHYITAAVFFLVFGLTASVVFVIALDNRAELTGDATSDAHHDKLVTYGIQGVAISLAPMAIVIFMAISGKLRRPYLHLGVSPGGGEHGRKNTLGSNSPFFML